MTGTILRDRFVLAVHDRRLRDLKEERTDKCADRTPSSGHHLWPRLAYVLQSAAQQDHHVWTCANDSNWSCWQSASLSPAVHRFLSPAPLLPQDDGHVRLRGLPEALWRGGAGPPLGAQGDAEPLAHPGAFKIAAVGGRQESGRPFRLSASLARVTGALLRRGVTAHATVLEQWYLYE